MAVSQLGCAKLNTTAILYCGGLTWSNVVKANCYVYQTTTNAITATGAMTVARYGHKIVEVQGSFCVVAMSQLFRSIVHRRREE